ncbi:hypothetical protein [Streptomyces fradiae]|uniref:hypothetical protein n=1 Tax=Streptomyces fradiae TaxID=1906 RepID=UPI002942E61A|nr:hypothetical protein [Streptomyces fradiae]WOI62329.1 hypothetical protein RYQ63_21880 [Streptomyces fradiae]
MVRKRVEIEYEEGVQLGRSRDGDGASSPNLFIPGSKGVKGQVKIYEIDEGEGDSLTGSPSVVYVTGEYGSDSRARERLEPEEIIEALVILVKAAERAAPHLKRWWNYQARPFIESTRNRLVRTRKADSQAITPEPSNLVESASSEDSQELATALDGHRVSMSSTEAQERFIAALVARLFSEEQLRILCNARIEDEDEALQLNGPTETLTPKQVEDSIILMLEANPSLLDEETLAEIGKILGGGRVERAPSIEKRNAKKGTTSG